MFLKLKLSTMKKINFIIMILIASCNTTFSQDKTKEYTSISEALKEPEKVFRLNLSNQNINISNENWSKFINLEYLNLKGDHLKEIPDGITTIKSLKSIDLSGNDFIYLPQKFLNLTNLEELFLNDEKYLNLPKTLNLLSNLPKLKSLHIENDNLAKLPSEILLLKNLESLYLNNNKFKEVPNLEALDHLKYLDLKDNKIKPELQDMKNLNFGFKINF
jgi:Leucine-rich repeat (LRR) protein